MLSKKKKKRINFFEKKKKKKKGIKGHWVYICYRLYIYYIVYTHKLQFLPKMLATNLIGYSLIYFGQNLAIKLVVP